MRFSRSQLRALGVKVPKANKLGARKVTIGGILFDSGAEGKRYRDLKILESKGEIVDLVVHPRYEIKINGLKVATYAPDFTYKRVQDGGKVLHSVIEDVKGNRHGATWAYFRLKVRVFEAVFNHVVEVYPPAPPRKPRRKKA